MGLKPTPISLTNTTTYRSVAIDIPNNLAHFRKGPNMYSRIVGGYHPKERPWMALIEMKSKRPRKRPRRPYARKKNSQCGGAIINKVSTYYVKSGVSFERIEYSSKFQSLCSMKCSSEMLQIFF